MVNTAATRTIEVVMFRAQPGVSDAQILEAADVLQRDVEEFGGYISRRLLKSEDGQWLDIVDWTSLDEARQAGEAIMQRPSAQRFDALVDAESVKVFHLAPLRVYAPEQALS